MRILRLCSTAMPLLTTAMLPWRNSEGARRGAIPVFRRISGIPTLLHRMRRMGAPILHR
jgi:hypothetical protein